MKHRAVIIGAGRIGCGFKWHDDAYTHIGAYRALDVTVDGFVEPDDERAAAAEKKWGIDRINLQSLQMLKPDVVSICVQPDKQDDVLPYCNTSRVIWAEKPYLAKRKAPAPVQVNYMRRADRKHQWIAENRHGGDLTVYGKDDIHTRCHFEDLAKWWKAKLIYKPVTGPCSYVYDWCNGEMFFDNGGVDGGTCFKAMCENLLDHIDKGIPLWSPAI